MCKVQTGTTNKDGLVTFSNVEGGQHKVIIAYEGYKGEQSINLSGSATNFDLNISVKPANLLLSPEVSVTIAILVGIIILLSIALYRKRSR